MTAVSAMPTMHDDVCSVAEEKRVSLIILPFHKHRPSGSADGGGAAAMENVGPGWRGVNQRVLREAPCSVTVVVDRGLGGGEEVAPAEVAREVCVVFFGGPDDREALELGQRMAEHPGVRVTVVRFVSTVAKGKEDRPTITLRPSPSKSAERSYTFSTAVMDRGREKELDDAAVAEFRQRTEGAARYEERPVGNVVEAVLEIGRSGEYELVVVGKGRSPSTMVAELAGRQAEHPELGPVGDALASSHNRVVSSVLVIQQHDVVHSEEAPVSMVFDGDAAVVDVAGSNHDQK